MPQMLSVYPVPLSSVSEVGTTSGMQSAKTLSALNKLVGATGSSAAKAHAGHAYAPLVLRSLEDGDE
jgi:hypothetical protein